MLCSQSPTKHYLEFGGSSFGEEFGVAKDVATKDVATWYQFLWASMRAAGGVDGEWYAVRCTGSIFGSVQEDEY